MVLPPRSIASRPGLSLLEVLVALFIFLLTFAALGQMITLSGKMATDVSERSQAMRLCQSKMNEFVVGIEPLQSQDGTPFDDDDSDWQWSVDCEEQGNITGLYTVTVTVSRTNQETSDSSGSYKLAQMVLDPSLRGSIFSMPPSVNSSSGSSSSSQGSDSSSSSSSSAAGGGAAGSSGSKTGKASGSGTKGGGGTMGGAGGGKSTGGGKSSGSTGSSGSGKSSGSTGSSGSGKSSGSTGSSGSGKSSGSTGSTGSTGGTGSGNTGTGGFKGR